MPNLKTYRLFISHSWTYSDAYEELVNFIYKHPNFSWIDYSVPRGDPIHSGNNDAKLYAAIRAQIQHVNCVILLAGVYSTYSRWIDKEIKISKTDFHKPIVAVELFGSEKTSALVKENADAIVKWQSKAIMDAIRDHAI